MCCFNTYTFDKSSEGVSLSLMSSHSSPFRCLWLSILPSCVASGSDISGNWEVVDAQTPKSNSRFYLNVCHKIIQSGGAANCPVKSSICAVGKNLKNGMFCKMILPQMFCGYSAFKNTLIKCLLLWWTWAVMFAAHLSLQIRIITPSAWAASSHPPKRLT